MDLRIQQEDKALVLAVAGKLDTLTAPEYESAALGLIDEGATKIVLDMAELSYISSAGLRSLIVTAKALKSKEGTLLLANVAGSVRDVFEMAGFGAIFTTYDSVPAALEAC